MGPGPWKRMVEALEARIRVSLADLGERLKGQTRRTFAHCEGLWGCGDAHLAHAHITSESAGEAFEDKVRETLGNLTDTARSTQQALLLSALGVLVVTIHFFGAAFHPAAEPGEARKKSGRSELIEEAV